MANWTKMREEWQKQLDNNNHERWLHDELKHNLSAVSGLLDEKNVILYFSAFLQKPENDLPTQMTSEDINPIMNAMYKMNYSKNLVIILHTPGGVLSAVEHIAKYIHSKFKEVTVIVPAMCMSAGSMFALSCDDIIISRAGQLGPTDPQINLPGKGSFSVRDIKQQFDKAREDILKNPSNAHVWAPVLASYGPALYEGAYNAEKYAQTKIKEWLEAKGKNPKQIKRIIEVFYEEPYIHGQRIDYDIMCDELMGLKVKLLEENQDLQNAVMQAYHLATIYAETTPMTKMVTNHTMENSWTKNAQR